MKVCAKCDKEKQFTEFNPGLASFGLKRVCKDCEENLSIHYRKQQSEVEHELERLKVKERLKDLRKDNSQKHKEVERKIKTQIVFLKEKKNGIWQTSKEIIEHLELEFQRGIIYRVLSDNAIKGRSNGTTRYYIKYKEF